MLPGTLPRVHPPGVGDGGGGEEEQEEQGAHGTGTQLGTLMAIGSCWLSYDCILLCAQET